MNRLLALAALSLVLAGCGGSADLTLATVGHERITQSQVDLLLGRAREEATNERLEFPARGTDVYRGLERQALGVLVYRARVEAAARRVGIAVTDAQARASAGLKGPRSKELPERVFEHAIAAVGLEEGRDEESALRLSETKLQLTLAALERRLGADGVKPWLDRALPSVPVRYA